MLDTDSRKRYGNLAGSHVVYAIAACKKYSSSYTPYFSLNLSGWVDGWYDSLSVNLRECHAEVRSLFGVT